MPYLHAEATLNLKPPKTDKPPLGAPRKRPKRPIDQPQSENPALHDKHVQLQIGKFGVLTSAVKYTTQQHAGTPPI